MYEDGIEVGGDLSGELSLGSDGVGDDVLDGERKLVMGELDVEEIGESNGEITEKQAKDLEVVVDIHSQGLACV